MKIWIISHRPPLTPTIHPFYKSVYLFVWVLDFLAPLLPLLHTHSVVYSVYRIVKINWVDRRHIQVSAKRNDHYQFYMQMIVACFKSGAKTQDTCRGGRIKRGHRKWFWTMGVGRRRVGTGWNLYFYPIVKYGDWIIELWHEFIVVSNRKYLKCNWNKICVVFVELNKYC